MNYKPAEASLSGVGSNGHPTRRPHYVMGPFLPSLTNPIWRFDTRDDEVTDTLKSASAISAQLLAPVDSQVAQLKSPIVLEARCGKGGRKVRAPWSKEEDITLIALLKLEDQDKPNWAKIAKQMKLKRSGKQCRERWQNHLRPNIKKGNWTNEEEHMIQCMFDAFGPKWTCMAKLLPNRTDNDIKNKWNSMSRSKKVKQKRAEKAIHENQEKNVVASAVASAVQGKTIPVACKPKVRRGEFNNLRSHRTGHIAVGGVGVASKGTTVYQGSDEPNCSDDDDTKVAKSDSSNDRTSPSGNDRARAYVPSPYVSRVASI